MVTFFVILGLALIPFFLVVSKAVGMVHGGVGWGATLAVASTALYPFATSVALFGLVYFIAGSLDPPAMLLGSLLIGLAISTVGCTVYGVPMGWQSTLVFALIVGVILTLAYDVTVGDLADVLGRVFVGQLTFSVLCTSVSPGLDAKKGR